VAITSTILLATIAIFTVPLVHRGSSDAPSFSSTSPTATDGDLIAVLPPSLSNLCPNSSTIQWDLVGYDSWIPLGGNLSIPLNARTLPSSLPAPRLCIVAQTSASQSPFSSTFSIDRFIASWLAQRSSEWKMILLDMSSLRNESFHYLHDYIHSVIEEAGVSQIQVHNASAYLRPAPDAAAVDDNIVPFPYALQAAKRLCPPSTQKLVFADASDWYHPDFVSAVLEHPTAADIIGVDFFSNDAIARKGVDRSLRSCLHLSEPPCSCNQITPNGAEVGALAFEYAKFSTLDPVSMIAAVSNCSSLAAEPRRDWQECLLRVLLDDNWNRSRLGRCLFSAAPNPHLCALYGHVTAHTTPFSASDFMCVPSKDTAELLIQEDVQEFKMPFFDSSCFHASRFGVKRTAPPTSSDVEITESSRNTSRSATESSMPAV
jgi:hypothetical protein